MLIFTLLITENGMNDIDAMLKIKKILYNPETRNTNFSEAISNNTT